MGSAKEQIAPLETPIPDKVQGYRCGFCLEGRDAYNLHWDEMKTAFCCPRCHHLSHLPMTLEEVCETLAEYLKVESR